MGRSSSCQGGAPRRPPPVRNTKCVRGGAYVYITVRLRARPGGGGRGGVAGALIVPRCGAMRGDAGRCEGWRVRCIMSHRTSPVVPRAHGPNVTLSPPWRQRTRNICCHTDSLISTGDCRQGRCDHAPRRCMADQRSTLARIGRGATAAGGEWRRRDYAASGLTVRRWPASPTFPHPACRLPPIGSAEPPNRPCRACRQSAARCLLPAAYCLIG
jgi:hypothetical protein